MTNQYAVVDIETSDLPLVEIEQFKPEFKAAGNLKDPEKIKASILEKEQAWKDELALSAVTGRILCIGALQDGNMLTWDQDNESVLLTGFLSYCEEKIQSGIALVGFCSRTFDVPFVIRRAFKHQLHIPRCFWEGRYLSALFVDVAERWACGDSRTLGTKKVDGKEQPNRISLDNLSRFLGTGEKNSNGADFAGLWASDREKALEYLKNDLLLTKAAYERLYL